MTEQKLPQIVKAKETLGYVVDILTPPLISLSEIPLALKYAKEAYEYLNDINLDK